MRALAYFTLKDLLYDRWRSLLTIAGLAVVVVAYLLLAALAQAFLVFSQQVRGPSNLVIVAADVIDPMESSLDDSLLETARQMAPDQIERVFPILFRHLNISGQIMQIRAAPLAELSGAFALNLFQGRWPTGPREVVVSEGVARLAAWSVGSTVNIYGADFQVTGLVRAGENNTGAVWMTYSEGQSLFGLRRGFQVAYLVLQPAADAEAVRARLQADPRLAEHYSVYLERALSSSYYQVSYNLLTLNNLMALAALLAITFGAYNATTLSLTERGHAIGLLRVLGFTPGKLRAILLARTLALTGAAYSLGWGLAGLLVSYYRAHLTLGVSAAPLVLSLTPAASLLGLVLTLLFASLGLWLTSGRLAALSPLAGGE